MNEKLTNWLDDLKTKNIDSLEFLDILPFLQEIEKEVLVNKNILRYKDKNIAFALLPLLNSKKWQVKAKAIITIGRVGDYTLNHIIIEKLKNSPENYWQLMLLDAWWQLPISIKEREEIIKDLLDTAKEPIVIRGIVCLLSMLKGEFALDLLGAFINKPESAIVKDEVLTACWFILANSLSEDIVAKVVRDKKNLKVWLRHRYWEEGASYSIYPSLDYLSKVAKDFEVNPREYKQIFLKPRSKQKK